MDNSDKNGFGRDKLNRKEFGDRLTKFLENQTDGNVFALDAGWGQGKTTFVEMWQEDSDNHLKTIYFDAFANDYQKDPFLALATEIYGEIQEESDCLRRSILDVEKVRAISSILSDALLEKIIGKAGSDVVKKLTEAHDAILTERLEEAKKTKSAIEAFRDSLKGHVEKISPGKPLIFIVDELDRCRPDFALDLLETIKHFFEVPGIIFLLVMNQKALSDMIHIRYGTDDGTRYMQKFVQFWINLPGPNVKRYAAFLYGRSQHNYDYTYELIERGSPNLREIQQIYTYEKLINSSANSHSDRLMEWAIPVMCYVKVVNPSYVQKILNMSKEDIIELDWESVLGFPLIHPFFHLERPYDMTKSIKKLSDINEEALGNPIGRAGPIEWAVEAIKLCAEILVILKNPNP